MECALCWLDPLNQYIHIYLNQYIHIYLMNRHACNMMRYNTLVDDSMILANTFITGSTMVMDYWLVFLLSPPWCADEGTSPEPSPKTMIGLHICVCLYLFLHLHGAILVQVSSNGSELPSLFVQH